MFAADIGPLNMNAPLTGKDGHSIADKAAHPVSLQQCSNCPYRSEFHALGPNVVEWIAYRMTPTPVSGIRQHVRTGDEAP
jgi:hypothetical protein